MLIGFANENLKKAGSSIGSFIGESTSSGSESAYLSLEFHMGNGTSCGKVSSRFFLLN